MDSQMYQSKTNEPTKKQEAKQDQAPIRKPTQLQQAIIKHVGNVNGNPINLEVLEEIRNIHKTDNEVFSQTKQIMQKELDDKKSREQQPGTQQDQSDSEDEIIRNVDVYKRMIRDKYHKQIDKDTVEK